LVPELKLVTVYVDVEKLLALTLLRLHLMLVAEHGMMQSCYSCIAGLSLRYHNWLVDLGQARPELCWVHEKAGDEQHSCHHELVHPGVEVGSHTLAWKQW
jgi:hypothetical protein